MLRWRVGQAEVSQTMCPGELSGRNVGINPHRTADGQPVVILKAGDVGDRVEMLGPHTPLFPNTNQRLR